MQQESEHKVKKHVNSHFQLHCFFSATNDIVNMFCFQQFLDFEIIEIKCVISQRLSGNERHKSL